MSLFCNKHSISQFVSAALVHEIESLKKEKEEIAARALKKCKYYTIS